MKKLIFALAFLATSLTTNVFAKDLITNFSKVNDGLYRGARLTSYEALQYLESLNVKSVVNLQGGDLESDIGIVIPWAEPGEKPEVIAQEKAAVLSVGMEFLHSPLNSLEAITKDEDKVIDETLEFMHDKKNQPVFIHCEHGADRTGLLVALYEVKYEGKSVQAAHDEWVQNGHNTIHQMFTGDLDTYFYAKVKQFQK